MSLGQIRHWESCPKKIKENRLSPKEKEKIIFEENMNMFPIRSKFFNERFRRAVVKSACRYGASNLTLAFREYLIQNRPHLDYPFQKTIMRTTIKALSNEWAAGRWAMADRESALLMLILTPFMTKNDTLLYALEAAIDAITFMDLKRNMIQALFKLSDDHPAEKKLFNDVNPRDELPRQVIPIGVTKCTGVFQY